MKTKKYSFEAELVQHPTQNATYIIFPYDAFEEFGARRVKVNATFDGHPYRGLLADMGMGHHIVGVNRLIREKIGKAAGDVISVTLERDTEERKIEVPPELAQALSNLPDLKKFFDSLSFTNRKEYVSWILEAKKEDTKQRRLQRVIENLRSGKKNPSDK